MKSMVDSPPNLEDGECWLPSSLTNEINYPYPNLPYTTNYNQTNHAAATYSDLNVSPNVQNFDASFSIMPNESRVPYAEHYRHHASSIVGFPVLALPLFNQGIERIRAMDSFGKCEGTGVFFPQRARFAKEVMSTGGTRTGAFFNHDGEGAGRKKRKNKKNRQGNQVKFVNKDETSEKKAESPTPLEKRAESPTPSELEICLPEEWTY